jgi:hypothetical protein
MGHRTQALETWDFGLMKLEDSGYTYKNVLVDVSKIRWVKERYFYLGLVFFNSIVYFFEQL